MARIYDEMDRKGLDVLLALAPENVFYLSDLPASPASANRLLNVVRNSSPSFCVVPLNGEPKLVVTNAAIELAEKNSFVKDIRTYATGTYIVRHSARKGIVAADPVEALAKVVRSLGRRTKVGIDEQVAAAGIVDRVRSSLKAVKVVDSTDLFGQLRMIKTPEEVRRFKEANRILCVAFERVIDEAGVGVSERELEFVLKSTIMKEGGDSWQQTTVAAGPVNGPDIYNQPTSKRIKKGDVIRLDVGCVYKGYTADLSRTLVAGSPPIRATKIYEVLRDAEADLLDACEPGVKASELHSLVVEYVKKNLDMKYTRGNVGHGCGVELYDRPFISENDHTEMQDGMTLSLEVPYHEFGLGGFNLEDSVVVTKKGKEVVSDLPKEMISI
jgi:Xaa-Pro aminopeptidase